MNYKKLFGLLVLFAGTFGATQVFAQLGLDDAAGAAGLTKYGGDVSVLIGKVIGAGLSMVSVIFFALMIYGGIRYMLARGNEENTKQAVNTIWAAVIGILIVLASYALTQFVFTSLGFEGGAATPNTSAPPGVTGGWCLVEGECIEGSGSPCPGQLFSSPEECSIALGTVAPAGTKQQVCHFASTGSECDSKNIDATCGGGNTCKIDGSSPDAVSETDTTIEFICVCTGG